MTVRPPSLSPQPADHNRRKQYLIPEGRPCPFLEALGVMTAAGTVLGKRQHKFRQINRYLELVDDIYAALPAEGCLHVVDFGCGLSYLTFAVHHLLNVVHARDVQIVGIDRNPEVIARCTGIAEALKLAGLQFVVGDIGDPALERHAAPLHLAISLHACDVASDAALAFAVRHRAQVILAAPCCQHELAGKLDDPSLKLITLHGILRERLAALATDALRAAALEAAGYHAQVMEFIETEHTPKNLMIRAIRRDVPGEVALWRKRYEEFRNRLGAASLASDQILPEEIVPGE